MIERIGRQSDVDRNMSYGHRYRPAVTGLQRSRVEHTGLASEVGGRPTDGLGLVGAGFHSYPVECRDSHVITTFDRPALVADQQFIAAGWSHQHLLGYRLRWRQDDLSPVHRYHYP